MTLRIHVETSVVSYLTARPSTDDLKAVKQQMTQRWWARDVPLGSVFISSYVIDEASKGDPQAAQERLESIRGLQALPATVEIESLAEYLLHGGGLPANARLDALHVACASVHRMDVLLTWNCTHIANPTQLPVMRGLCAALGYRLPELVTP